MVQFNTLDNVRSPAICLMFPNQGFKEFQGFGEYRQGLREKSWNISKHTHTHTQINVANHFKYPSKYFGNFCLAIRNTPSCYQIPLYFWPLNIFIDNGSSRHEDLFQGFLCGRNFEKRWLCLS
jgi:hypothetical protein